MMAATRLVRAGKLAEVTASLQRAFLDAGARPGAARAPAAEAPQDPAFVRRRYANAFGARTYKVYAPAHQPARGLPVVVMLHGCTQNPDDFAAGTQMNRLAEEHGLVVVYPAQSRGANPNNCWNWFQSEHQVREQGEPSLIAGITREVLEQQGDARRVYIAGLSAGGAMAAVMGATYPDLYAAIGVHSGLPHGAAQDLPSAFAAMRGQGTSRHNGHGSSTRRPVPIIAFHGDEDATVHASNSVIVEATGARLEVEQGERNGRAFTRTSQFGANGKSVVEHWIVHGAGHAWSGGSPAGSFTDSRGPEASREMLRFFLQHASGS
jgi:poly(hydroxyalkanoate) depolymerase family esterase